MTCPHEHGNPDAPQAPITGYWQEKARQLIAALTPHFQHEGQCQVRIVAAALVEAYRQGAQYVTPLEDK